MVTSVIADPTRLEAATAAIFRAAGSNAREAALVGRHLVEANLRGHDSHGVGMLPFYLENIRRGHIRLNQSVAVLTDTGAALVVDGRQGAGQAMAHDAIDLGIARAREAGACIVALRNSHHIGRIGHWAEQCAEAGLVSIHFVNVVSQPAVAPFGGAAARLGTNPFAVGVPRTGGPPIVVDFATSRWAAGKVRVAYNKGLPVPPGVLLDVDGRETLDPATYFAEPHGALVTFGEHKGWCLALACELLAGALTGGNVQVGQPVSGANVNSMLSIIVSPDRLGTGPAFAAAVAEVVGFVTSEPGEGGPRVRLPGDPERETRAKRLEGGIAVDGTTWQQIVTGAAAIGVDAAMLAGVLRKVEEPTT